jgi:hypothetical protein
MCSTTFHRVVVLVTAWLVFALANRPAAADNIDHELLAQMPKLIRACQDKGYSRIGVLTFLYQHGIQPSKFGGATICNNMPSRLENALVLKLNSKQPELIVLPRAVQAASSAIPHASYRTAADRQKLLNLPLAPLWGESAKVKADAFLIGKVRASQDFRQVTVSIGAFDRQSMFDIVEFTVLMDRYILSDLGQGFSLAQRRVRGISDDAILDGVADDLKATDQVVTGAQPADFPVALTVHYDDQPQSMRDDPAADGSYNYSLPEPQEGQSLTFGLRNVTNQPVGVVLLVNGTSTLYEQEGEPADLTKWVLEPGKDYRVKGYHQEGNEKYFEITTLSEEESKQRYDDLGGAKFAGLIHLHVFQKQTSADEIPSFTRSIGRFSRSQRQPALFTTLPEAKQAIARKSDIYPPGTRPLAGWGREQTQTLAEMELGPATLTGTLVVRYSNTRP